VSTARSRPASIRARRTTLVAAFIAAFVAAALAASPARAYRPFDQTDADVAEPRTIELEIGPVGYTHDASGDTFTPSFVFNYGVVSRLELVFDTHHAVIWGGADLARRRRALETALLAKVVVREGSLQGGVGPSVAFEGGALLPTIPAAGDLGAALTAIASQRWPALTLHVDLEGDRTRAGTFAFIGGAIVEGPNAWTVRPVAETFVARDGDGPTTVSGLAGAIWRASAHVAFDAAGRVARQADANVYELRAGLTWDFGI
jgi:hypothetical protein